MGPIVAEAPRWYPKWELPSRPERYVGHVAAMWRLHTELHKSLTPLTRGHAGPDQAQVIGFPGSGKSMLVQEYAMRFAAAFPGGVLWHTVAQDPKQRGDVWEDLLRVVAVELGIETSSDAHPREAVFEALRARGRRVLFVIDDLPGDVSLDAIKAWCAPKDVGATVVTTQSRHLVQAFGSVIELQSLCRDDAVELLTGGADLSDTDEAAACSIAESVGRHPLALTVLKGYRDAVPKSLAALADDLKSVDSRNLVHAETLASEVGMQLPTRSGLAITSVLITAVQGLSQHAQTILGWMSQLASRPVPASILVGAWKRAFSDHEILDFERALAEATFRSLIETRQASVSAHELIRRAVRIASGSSHQDTTALSQAARELAVAAAGNLRHNELRSLVPHAVHIAESQSPVDTSLLVDAGILQRAAGGYRSARRLLELALNAMTPDCFDYPRALDNLAICHGEMGNINEAKRIHFDVLWPLLRDDGHPGGDARIIRHIVQTLNDAGEHDEARKLLDASREFDRPALSTLVEMIRMATDSDWEGVARLQHDAKPSSPDDLLDRELTEAEVMWQEGQGWEVIRKLENLLDTVTADFGNDHSVVTFVHHQLGFYLGELGEHERALPHSLVAYESRSVEGDYDSLELQTSAHVLGSNLYGLGRFGEAIDVFKPVWNARKRDPDRPRQLQNTGTYYLDALLKMERASDAVEVLRRLRDVNPEAFWPFLIFLTSEEKDLEELTEEVREYVTASSSFDSAVGGLLVLPKKVREGYRLDARGQERLAQIHEAFVQVASTDSECSDATFDALVSALASILFLDGARSGVFMTPKAGQISVGRRVQPYIDARRALSQVGGSKPKDTLNSAVRSHSSAPLGVGLASPALRRPQADGDGAHEDPPLPGVGTSVDPTHADARNNLAEPISELASLRWYQRVLALLVLALVRLGPREGTKVMLMVTALAVTAALASSAMLLLLALSYWW